MRLQPTARTRRSPYRGRAPRAAATNRPTSRCCAPATRARRGRAAPGPRPRSRAPGRRRAVVLDVGRLAVRVGLDIGGPVEVRHRDGQAAGLRVVGEGPPEGVGGGEDEPAAGPQHPGRLAHQRRRVGDEGHCTVCREHDVEAALAEGQGVPSHWRSGTAARGSLTLWLRVRAVRSIPRDRSVATTEAPWVASQREHCPAPAPISRTRRPATSPSRCSSDSRQPSAPRRSRRPPGSGRARRSSRLPRHPTTTGWRRPSRPHRPTGG